MNSLHAWTFASAESVSNFGLDAARCSGSCPDLGGFTQHRSKHSRQVGQTSRGRMDRLREVEKTIDDLWSMRLPSSRSWLVASLILSLYLLFTEVLLIGGVNLGLLTEGLLIRFGLRGIWSAVTSLGIYVLATSLIAFVIGWKGGNKYGQV